MAIKELREVSRRRASAAWKAFKHSWPLWFVGLAVIAMFVIAGRINAPKLPILVESPISVVAEPQAPSSSQFDALVSQIGNVTSDGWVALLTGLLVIVALAQAALFVWQLRLIRKSLVDTRKAADAAQSSADTAEQALKTTQRAYLSANPHGITPFNPNQIAIGHVEFYNAGNLPARDVSYVIAMDCSRDRDRSEFEVDETKLRGKNVVAPRNGMKQGAEQTFSDDDVMAFEMGDRDEFVIYVWGVVYYNDGFVERRRLAFCHRYDNRGYAESTQHPVGRCVVLEGMRYHEHGNSAD